MPAASLQSRINVFESLGQQSLPPINTKSPSKPSLNLLETPISPIASSFTSIAPCKVPHSTSRSPSPSPPILGRKTSLIDLRDWVVDDGPSPTLQNGFGAVARSDQNHIAKPNLSANALINIDSSAKPRHIKAPPPLPPRKTSSNSVESTSSSNSAQTRNGSITSTKSARRPDNLAVEHTYPPLSKHEAPDFPRRGGHVPASSVSSFHSVSLSSDGGITDGGTPGSVNIHIATFPMDRECNEVDTLSLDDSFEDVSTSSIVSPTTAAALAINWESKRTLEPPKLPQRPPPKPFARLPASPKTPTRPSSTSPARRGPPPPPPPRPGSVRTSLISTTASDRSSILSTGTATTSRTSMSSAPALMHKLSVPLAARKRYEIVFVANVLQQRQQAATVKTRKVVRKTRQAAGWRGLSVDLITNYPDHPLNSDKKRDNGALRDGTPDEGNKVVGPEEKLDGCIIKFIWSASKLEREKLRLIWNECDISNDGALDREAFVKGMWRIDEELRKAQGKSWSSSNGTNHLRPHPKQTAAKPILH